MATSENPDVKEKKDDQRLKGKKEHIRKKAWRPKTKTGCVTCRYVPHLLFLARESPRGLYVALLLVRPWATPTRKVGKGGSLQGA